MNQLLKIELKKALTNNFFIISVLIGTVICVAGAVLMINSYFEQQAMIKAAEEYSGLVINPNLPSNTLYNHWIGGEYVTLMQSLFFFILPLLAAIPYGWSYFAERKSGYIKNVMIRMDKKAVYFISKYIAVFLSGGLAVIIPLIINLMVTAMFIPAVRPDISYDLYLAVFKGDLWCGFFYTKPFLYVVLYLSLIFLYSGAIANIGLLVSFIVKYRFMAVLFPLFMFLLIHYGSEMLGYVLRAELSPLYFLHPSTIRGVTRAYVVGLEAAVIFFVPFIISLHWGIKDDIF